MKRAPTLAISTPHLETLLTLVERHLPATPIWAYGSRTKGTSHTRSDLDLAVTASPEQRDQIGALREALEESNLPFRVDLHVWADLPEPARATILAHHVDLDTLRRARRAKRHAPERD